jgi:hypothetical protein
LTEYIFFIFHFFSSHYAVRPFSAAFLSLIEADRLLMLPATADCRHYAAFTTDTPSFHFHATPVSQSAIFELSCAAIAATMPIS